MEKIKKFKVIENQRKKIKFLVFFGITFFLWFFLLSNTWKERLNVWKSIYASHYSDVKIENESSLKEIYMGMEKQKLSKWISRKYKVALSATEKIVDLAFNAADKFNLDPHLILAVIAIESSYNPLAESFAGAQGLMQIMPEIHKEKFLHFKEKDPALTLDKNVYVGAQILREYLNRFGSEKRALLAYVGVGPNGNSLYPDKVMLMRHRLLNVSESTLN